ncbi:Mu-like prophage major head subunit gpT family protein [Tahibacter soli]|uniref:Mu-like prophage major head subunit gpT family protein n=1 Tax=Tahibacter soli TaxID=2983605 RepID=A0A9X3YKI7_9GAMM|nr:Mu-like prophage major head subunit gpT family protein [Tahibacter soli]MDC8012935.1 Mu-like prophage major head subunit gpT family protein [Tahibacter soli]
MIITRQNLATLNTAYRTAYQIGFDGAPSEWEEIATEVPSTTGSEEYGWLGQIPGMREWIGERQINNLQQHGYTIRNKSWEDTVAVPVPVIEDDQYGTYTPLMTELGRAAKTHPNQLVFGLLKNGFATRCYDQQYFFDTDHPVVGEDGSVQSVSNFGGGSGQPWFVLDTTRALKPLILQMRKRPAFVAKNQPNDDNVFEKNEAVFGVDGRWNVGLGFWQMAYASKQTLDEAALSAAIATIKSQKGDGGRPLGITPNILVVPPVLETAAEKLVTAIYAANGASNVMAGKLKVRAPAWMA